MNEVFVDALMSCVPNLAWRWDQSCHLFVAPATSLDVLHGFAAKIGMRRQWFQNPPGAMPHYDLTPGRRPRAIAAGAKPLSREETVAVLRQWRQRAPADASMA